MPSEMRPGLPRTVYLMKRAYTVVRSGMEAALQPLGLTPQQYLTLSLLRDRSDQSSADLARAAGITPQSMSETIAGLIRKGLIERSENPEHRRILMARLTATGQATLAACEATVDGLENRLFAGIAAGDRERLRQALRTVAKAGAKAGVKAG